MRTEERKLSMPLILIALLVPCVLFAGLDRAPGLHKDNVIVSDGIQRTFDYYIPANLPTKPTLLLLLHGHGGEADGMTGESGKAAPFKVWMTIADTSQFICVYPEGEFSPIENNARGWNDCRKTAQSNPDVNDVAFLTGLIDTFALQFSVTPKRTFAAGMSNGGFMAMRLATEVPEKFAGFAAVAASMAQTSECAAPTVPASVLFMNGTDDPILPFEGGYMDGDTTGARGDALSTWEAVNAWLSVNQITSAPKIDSLPDKRKDDSSSVVRYYWESPSGSEKVVFYEVQKGGHAEPSYLEFYSKWWQDGGAFSWDGVGNQNHDIEMAYEIWGFFSTLEPNSASSAPQPFILYDKSIIYNRQYRYDLQGRQINGYANIHNAQLIIVKDNLLARKVTLGN